MGPAFRWEPAHADLSGGEESTGSVFRRPRRVESALSAAADVEWREIHGAGKAIDYKPSNHVYAYAMTSLVTTRNP
jgi:hypothetical protein